VVQFVILKIITKGNFKDVSHGGWNHDQFEACIKLPFVEGINRAVKQKPTDGRLTFDFALYILEITMQRRRHYE